MVIDLSWIRLSVVKMDVRVGKGSDPVRVRCGAVLTGEDARAGSASRSADKLLLL